MKRRLFNLLAGVSFLLCVAIASLWVRSHWREDQIQTPDRRYAFSTTPGKIWAEAADRPYWTGIPYISRPVNVRFASNPAYAGLFKITTQGNGMHIFRIYAICGFVYYAYLQGNGPTAVWFTNLAVPFWFLTLLASALPIFWLRSHLTRAQPGHCPACGYDLRATPDRCPECGTIPEKTLVVK